MTKQTDEELFEQYLDNQFRAGMMDQVSKMKMLEDFRSARAQRRASTYALYAAVAAAVSTLAAIASVVISIVALHSK